MGHMSTRSRTYLPTATMTVSATDCLNGRAGEAADRAGFLEYIASGGNSSLILLHSLRTLSPESTHALIGHQLNVATMHFSTKRRKLISGSWDRTARVWQPTTTSEESNENSGRGSGSGWDTELVLEQHEEAVWGVMAIDDGPQEGGWLTASGELLLS